MQKDSQFMYLLESFDCVLYPGLAEGTADTIFSTVFSNIKMSRIQYF